MSTPGEKDSSKERGGSQAEAQERAQRELKQTILNQVGVILNTPDLGLELALHYSIALQAAFQRRDDAGLKITFSPTEATQIRQAQDILRAIITENVPQKTSLTPPELQTEMRQIIEAFAVFTTTLQQQLLYRDRGTAQQAVQEFIAQQLETQRTRGTGLVQLVTILGDNLLHELDQIFPPPEETEDKKPDNSQVPPHLYQRIDTLIENIERLYTYLNHAREDARQTARVQLNKALGHLRKIQRTLELYERRIQADTDIPVPEQARRLEEVGEALDRVVEAIAEIGTRIERSNKVLEEQSQQREYQQWDANPRIQMLRRRIDDVRRDIILEGPDMNIAPHSNRPGAYTEVRLRLEVTQLEEARDNARNAGVLDRSAYGERTANEIRDLVGDNGEGGRYGEAQEHLRQAIEFSRQEPKEVVARKKIDKLWAIIAENYKAPINGPESVVSKAAQEILDDYAEFLSQDERDLLGITFKCRDAWSEAAGSDAGKHLAWEKNVDARKIVQSKDVVTEELRKILTYGQFRFTDKEGSQQLTNLTSIFDTIHDEYFGGPYEYAPGKYWDYAGQGNPTTKDQKETVPPVPKIMDLVERDFPEVKEFPAFLKSLITYMIFIAEPRSDQFIYRYVCYKGSPIPGFDAEDADSAAPLSGVGYKAQSGGYFPFHRLLSVATRFPKTLEGYADDELVLHDKFLGQGPDASGWSKIKATWNKYLTAMNSYLPSVEVREVTYKGNKKPENMQTLISVRNRFLFDNFPSGFPYVQAHADLKIRPTLWDIARGKWRGVEIPVMSYFDYITLSTMLREFEDYVDTGFQQIKDDHELDTAVGGLVDKIKVFKALIFYLNDIETADRKRREAEARANGTEVAPSNEFDQLISIVQLMSLMYLKRQYVKYKESEEKKFQKSKRSEQKYSKERFKTTLSKFASIVLEVMEEAGTLPGPILHGGEFPLHDILRAMQGKTGLGISLNKWSVIFEDDEFVKSGQAKRKFETFWPGEFTHIYERWMRATKLKDKDPNE